MQFLQCGFKWMDGWTDGPMDRQTNGGMDRYIDPWMDNNSLSLKCNLKMMIFQQFCIFYRGITDWQTDQLTDQWTDQQRTDIPWYWDATVASINDIYDFTQLLFCFIYRKHWITFWKSLSLHQLSGNIDKRWIQKNSHHWKCK